MTDENVTDENVTDENTLLGVVSINGGRPLDHAAAVVANSLSATRDRLIELRMRRDQINEEVRQLVDDEELLVRMHRVTMRRNEGDAADGA